MNPKFRYPTAYRFAIAKVPKRKLVKANTNPRACLLVLQGLKPFYEWPLPLGVLVVADFNHWKQCNLKITILSISLRSNLALPSVLQRIWLYPRTLRALIGITWASVTSFVHYFAQSFISTLRFMSRSPRR